MGEKYNIKDALEYVNRIENGEIENPFLTRECVESLNEFSKESDEERFKKVVNFMVDFIAKSNLDQMKSHKKEPLAMIEFQCIMLDHPIEAGNIMFKAFRGIKVERLPTGKNQRFFQKLYGNHFYIE